MLPPVSGLQSTIPTHTHIRPYISYTHRVHLSVDTDLTLPSSPSTRSCTHTHHTLTPSLSLSPSPFSQFNGDLALRPSWDPFFVLDRFITSCLPPNLSPLRGASRSQYIPFPSHVRLSGQRPTEPTETTVHAGSSESDFRSLVRSAICYYLLAND